jgi:hypothetical protein
MGLATDLHKGPRDLGAAPCRVIPYPATRQFESLLGKRLRLEGGTPLTSW